MRSASPDEVEQINKLEMVQERLGNLDIVCSC